MHQNCASPFASDFYRRRGYRREFRSEDHFYPFSSQKKSRFASDFLRRGNRASWGLKKSRFFGSGKNRRRSRRASRDFGALRSGCRSCGHKLSPEKTSHKSPPSPKVPGRVKSRWVGSSSRERKLNPNFFSQTFRAPPGYAGKILGYPAQKV